MVGIDLNQKGMQMPQKFGSAAGDSMFTNARSAYSKDAGGGILLSGNYDSSQHIHLKKSMHHVLCEY